MWSWRLHDCTQVSTSEGVLECYVLISVWRSGTSQCSCRPGDPQSLCGAEDSLTARISGACVDVHNVVCLLYDECRVLARALEAGHLKKLMGTWDSEIIGWAISREIFCFQSSVSYVGDIRAKHSTWLYQPKGLHSLSNTISRNSTRLAHQHCPGMRPCVRMKCKPSNHK